MNDDMKPMSLSQAVEYFMMDRETFCSGNTLYNYRNTLRYFVTYMESARMLPADQIIFQSLTSADLKKYEIFLRNKPANEGHPFKLEVDEDSRLSRRTVRNYCVDVKTFMNFMINEEFIDPKVLRNFKIIKAGSKAIIPLSGSEVVKLDGMFNANSYTGIRNLCILHLMLDAGLRSNEVCELRVSHVLLDNRQIYIKFGKGSKQRVVPMGQTLKKYLWSWLNLYRKFSEDDYFLSCSNGSQLTEAAIKSLFTRIRSKTGIVRIYPHLLRHTFATCYIIGGGSVELLRILMGHASIQTTQIYMHVASVYDFQEDIYELDPIFFRTYHRNENVSRRRS